MLDRPGQPEGEYGDGTAGETCPEKYCLAVADEAFQSLYNYVVPIQKVGNPNPANLYLMGRPDLLYAFTKINLWRMTQWRKVVFLDADMVALRAPDELFEIEEDFAAAPDIGWPDAFNTGLMVLKPNMGEYWALQTMAAVGDSFDGADQGLLNQYFEHRPWKRLSFAYNCTPNAEYQYEPAYRYYKSNISMVHFIGAQKPWQQGRSALGKSGGYQELLSRWWAVYDRHFKVSTSDLIAGQGHAIQQQVKQDPHPQQENYSTSGYPAESTGPAPPPEAPAVSTEAPFTEPGEVVENIDQGLQEPIPTVQVRKFSAPHMEWDATRAPPPPDAKPEAANFQNTTYEFNNDPTPFRPPASYPEPPKDMWYEVPKEKPREEKLAPIFPWEEREMPKPTRKFVEDQPPPKPEVKATREVSFAGADELSVEADEPPTPTIKLNDQPQPPQQPKKFWEALGTTNKNAWDEVAGIDSYVRALSAHQRRQGKPGPQNHIVSPTNEGQVDEMIRQVEKRRESMILTDFPTESENPSLAVTPAPIRRPSFWGTEKENDDLGGIDDMPSAEGVPDQADWNATEQLEVLRRNSLLGPNDLKMPAKKNIPRRDMPPSSAPVTEKALNHPHVWANATKEAGEGAKHVGFAETAVVKPIFVEPEFGAGGKEDGVVDEQEKEVELSPTQTRDE